VARVAGHPRFAHLSARSTFSLRDGTIPPERLASAASEAGMTHVALTDRDGVSGAVRFVRAAADAGITPVLGVDLAIAGPPASRRGPAAGPRRREEDRSRVTLLALDEAGFADLCRATTRAHDNDRSAPQLRTGPRADRPSGGSEDLDLLAASGRVVAVLGASSSVGRLLAQGRLDAATVELGSWRERLGSERVVLGVRDHRVAPGGRRSQGRPDPDEPGDDTRIRRTLELAERTGTVAVAVNDVRHERPDDARIADVLRCIRLGVPLDGRHLGRTTSAA
jgi:error-prone DNA polymerase